MFWLIFLLIICIMLIPFPVFIKITYKNKNFQLFLYNKKLNINMDKRKKDMKINLSIKDYNNILSKINNTKVKPILKFNLILKYGTGDAAVTALTYGAINILFPFTFELMKMVFHVSKFEYDIHPDFNIIIMDLEIKSIIFINIFITIFTSFLVIKEIKHANTKKNI